MKYDTENNNHSTLLLSGDVMTGRGIDQVLKNTSDPVLHERYIKNAKRYVELAERVSGPMPEQVHYDYIWGDALEEMNRMKPAPRIINLETAITKSEDFWPDKGIHYRMHPKNVRILSEAAVDIAVIGNNHILDWGYNGLMDTMDILGENKILYAGAGPDSRSASMPAVHDTGNGRVLVFSYAMRNAGVPPDWKATPDKAGINLLTDLGSRGLEQVMTDVDRFRYRGDCVILSLHWSSNWGFEISSKERNFAHRLIESGHADLIHGHSSHHPKALEVHQGHLIIYGCGDLINDYEGIQGHEKYRGDLSLLYFPILNSDGKLISLTLKPFKINRFRLERTRLRDRDWLAGCLNREYEKFGFRIEQNAEGYFELQWEM